MDVHMKLKSLVVLGQVSEKKAIGFGYDDDGPGVLRDNNTQHHPARYPAIQPLPHTVRGREMRSDHSRPSHSLQAEYAARLVFCTDLIHLSTPSPTPLTYTLTASRVHNTPGHSSHVRRGKYQGRGPVREHPPPCRRFGHHVMLAARLPICDMATPLTKVKMPPAQLSRWVKAAELGAPHCCSSSSHVSRPQLY